MANRRRGLFGPELYRQRVVIDHAKAWLDRGKTLLVRDEAGIGNGLALRAFLLRKTNVKPTF